jgi:hypothetical protein
MHPRSKVSASSEQARRVCRERKGCLSGTAQGRNYIVRIDRVRFRRAEEGDDRVVFHPRHKKWPSAFGRRRPTVCSWDRAPARRLGELILSTCPSTVSVPLDYIAAVVRRRANGNLRKFVHVLRKARG